MIIAVPVAFADEALTAEIADDLAVVEVALHDTTMSAGTMWRKTVAGSSRRRMPPSSPPIVATEPRRMRRAF